MEKNKTYKRRIDHSWDFKGADTKEYTHCYHSYPAMMIPQIARRLIAEYKPENAFSLLDPYCGSGTSLLEGLLAGLCVCGYDLNPLARFISRTKCRTYSDKPIDKYILGIKDKLDNYSEDKVRSKDFSRLTKSNYWYSEDTLLKLSYIQQVIDDDPEIDHYTRDFFNVALAETVREVSFTRKGEFKRYRMSEEKLKSYKPDVFGAFISRLNRNYEGLEQFRKYVSDNLDIKPASVIMDVNSCHLRRDFLSIFSACGGQPYDMVVTSPPYGDSKTTVAYGEFSRWANEWFGFEHSKDLDKILMGGELERSQIFTSETTQGALDKIKAIDEKRYFEVISFLNDYCRSIRNVAEMVAYGGVVCYVVGNRTVKGVQIPLDYFTAEMFEQNGFHHIETIVREFPSKRMPAKNSPTNKTGEKSNTMTNEYIVILKKF